MRNAQGKVPSGSMIVAIIALIAALGGTAYAASLITSKDIQNGTIKKADLSKSLKKKIARAGQKGDKGDQGDPGGQGPQGAPGEQGDPGTQGSGSTVGPVGFERDGFLIGNINGQNGWSKTGPFDANVKATSGYPAASGYGFGAQTLQISNEVSSGSFSDQTFSRGLADEAGEADSSNGGFGSGNAQSRFEATFKIGTAVTTHQAGLGLSIAADQGSGSRMSQVRFEDQADGVHVLFSEVTGGSTPTFEVNDVKTLTRGAAHTVKLTIDFVDGPSNDVVTVNIDGQQVASGTSWEDYYRYDPEQAGNNNLVPTVDKLLFRASTAGPGTSGNGFLIDGVQLKSSTP